MRRSGAFASSTAIAAALLGTTVSAAVEPSAFEVEEGLRKAISYYTEKVAYRGGYVYFYSPDLSKRLGEGVASSTQVWVQPPGTPTVGLALLEAYRATGDESILVAAKAAGMALRYGQLESGGWQNSIEFNPDSPRVNLYRQGGGKGRNYSTLDDGISQTALRFLVRLDEALGFADADISDTVQYGLEALLDAQFANGAFPQVWEKESETVGEQKARYPSHDWRTEGRIKDYWYQYTLNDGVAGSVTDLLITAHEVYQDEKYSEALRRLGNFLILAQMPDPQPAWAQQYNREMEPIWARAFEPPAVSGRESEDAMVALLKIFVHLGDERFLSPIVPAVKYLESSFLPDGRLARYYELETNKPLYMERSSGNYELTHDDSNLPDHYGWKNEPKLDLIKAGYRAVTAGEPLAPALGETEPTEDEVSGILAALDDEGRWISEFAGERLVGQPKFQPGEKYLASGVFADNVTALSRYLVQAK